MKQRNCKCNAKTGFTLIELLVVIAIISILASIVLGALNSAREKARDSERIQSLDAFKTALELYYADNGKYPNADSVAPREGFSYHKYINGSCALDEWYDQQDILPEDNVRLDNSASPGFISDLFDEGYMSAEDWNDPNNPDENNDRYNCRYIVPEVEATVENVQHYLLHCNLESTGSLEETDSGKNDTVYEIMMPNAWICICGQNGRGGPTVTPMSPGSCGNPYED